MEVPEGNRLDCGESTQARELNQWECTITGVKKRVCLRALRLIGICENRIAKWNEKGVRRIIELVS